MKIIKNISLSLYEAPQSFNHQRTGDKWTNVQDL